MKPLVKIHRYWQDFNQTSGTCVILDKKSFPIFSSLSLERGWRNNLNRISCIPSGLYDLKLEYSDRFRKNLWEIKGVNGRSETKFHAANYWNQLEGCISLGLRYTDMNSDGYKDVTNSVPTMEDFHKALGNHKEALLLIVTEPKLF
jgi:hypothetical protein